MPGGPDAGSTRRPRRLPRQPVRPAVACSAGRRRRRAAPLAERAVRPGAFACRPRAAGGGVGSGLAGLGCAYRLWRQHGLRSEVYEYNAHRIGGRVQTLHGFFDAGQYAEQHGEFISSEHTADAQARHQLRADRGQRAELPAAHQAAGLPDAVRRPVLVPGRAGPGLARMGPGAVPRRGEQQGAVADPVQPSSALGAALGPHAGDRVDRAQHPRRARTPTSASCAYGPAR